MILVDNYSIGQSCDFHSIWETQYHYGRNPAHDNGDFGDIWRWGIVGFTTLICFICIFHGSGCHFSELSKGISSSHGFHRPGGHPTYSLDGEGGMLWAVSQAAPLRRAVVDHNLFLWYLRLPPAGVSSKDARRSENVEKKRAEFLGVVPGF